MEFFQAIWDFPAHHVSLGWWLAAVLTLWNLLAKILFGLLVRLSILGRRFRIDQLKKKIANIEYLHDNTNGLLRYFIRDVIECSIQICGNIILLTIFLLRISAVHQSAVLLIIVFNSATIILGPALRTRTILTDLFYYPKSVERLKSKLIHIENRLH
jgi:hypothetical protein